MKIELEKEYENGNEVRNGVRNENGVRNWNWIFFKCLLEMKYWFESRNFLYEVRTVYYLFADSLHIFTHTENTIFLLSLERVFFLEIEMKFFKKFIWFVWYISVMNLFEYS